MVRLESRISGRRRRKNSMEANLLSKNVAASGHLCRHAQRTRSAVRVESNDTRSWRITLNDLSLGCHVDGGELERSWRSISLVELDVLYGPKAAITGRNNHQLSCW